MVDGVDFLLLLLLFSSLFVCLFAFLYFLEDNSGFKNTAFILNTLLVKLILIICMSSTTATQKSTIVISWRSNK